MAGYESYSQSNNAISAKDNGRFPASILAKRIGVKTGAIKALMMSCEWHHTSSRFNTTDFYNEEDALEILGRLKEWKDSREVEISENCQITYKEWSGSRKHPTCREITIEAQIEKKGEWYKIYPVSGAKAFRKKETNIVRVTTKGEDNGKM